MKNFLDSDNGRSIPRTMSVHVMMSCRHAEYENMRSHYYHCVTLLTFF
jgi:hypothetical protein